MPERLHLLPLKIEVNPILGNPQTPTPIDPSVRSITICSRFALRFLPELLIPEGYPLRGAG